MADAELHMYFKIGLLKLLLLIAICFIFQICWLIGFKVLWLPMTRV